jgi:hypothetical protein
MLLQKPCDRATRHEARPGLSLCPGLERVDHMVWRLHYGDELEIIVHKLVY